MILENKNNYKYSLNVNLVSNITCSKLTIETLEQGVKHVQS